MTNTVKFYTIDRLCLWGEARRPASEDRDGGGRPGERPRRTGAEKAKYREEKGTKIVEDKKFQPYVPADKVMPEFTAVSILLGALLAIIFGGANAYLGLRVGMTVSASIPAAVISMGVIRKVLRRDSILENNMVQTIGSAGESVAALSLIHI